MGSFPDNKYRRKCIGESQEHEIMGLKSYSYGKDFDLNIWGLFEDAKKLGTRLDHTLEIVEAAQEGRIDLGHKFELEKYINRINRTRKFESLREAKKKIPVVGDSYDEEDVSGVASDSQMYLADARDAYGELMDDSELQYAVEMLNSLNAYYVVEAKCDFKHVVRQALKGIPDSIKAVKEVCEEYPVAAELLKIILGSGQPYESLFSDIK